MTIKPHSDAPCWEIVDADSLQPPQAESGDGWPHYATREAAEKDLPAEVETWERPLAVCQSFDRPCLALFCDGPGCRVADEPCDMDDEGWTHLDPADPLPFPITDMDWTVEERAGLPDRHYCPDCTPPWCHECDERHHGDCPEAGLPHQAAPVIPGQLALEVSP